MTGPKMHSRPRPIDQYERDLQDQWYEAREALVNAGFPDSGPVRQAFDHIDFKLSSYLWNRVEKDIASDRAKHPKARRNQGKPLDLPPNLNGRNTL